MKEILGEKYVLIVDNRNTGENVIEAVVELDDFDRKSLILKGNRFSVVLRLKEE